MLTRNHPEWADFEEGVTERIAGHTRELESLIDFDRTNFVRGQIAALRALIADAEAPPAGAPPPKY